MTGEPLPMPSAVEYKALKQYQTFGDMLDEFKTYGFSAGFDNMTRPGTRLPVNNGHVWLTEEPGLKLRP